MRPLLVALALLAIAAPAAEARSSQFTIFEASRELKSNDAALRARTFDEIQRFGVKWIRVVMYWREVAPAPRRNGVPQFDQTDPLAYNWGVYERLISEARARGLHVLVTPSGPGPDWATLGHNGVSYPSPTRFGRFMTAVGRQFGSRIRYWSIWNEPNHPQFLRPQYRRHKAYSPRLYRRLFLAAHKALNRTGNRRDRVLMGETAPRGNRHVVFPIRFLRGALCLNKHYRKKRRCKKLPADGYAHHPYTTRSGPYFVSPRRNDVTIGSLGRLTRALNRAARAHAIRRHMPIYLTEFGIQSKPDPVYGVSQKRQAEYRSIGEHIAYRNRRVRAISQYLMRDDRPGRGRNRYGGFESGLRFHGGRKKLAYRGFRLPLVAHRKGRRRVKLWGLVRPHDGRERVEVQYKRRHGRWHHLKWDRTNRRGYWTARVRYRRHREYRARWRSPEGTRYGGAPTRVTRRG
jgi:hypothetical protein